MGHNQYASKKSAISASTDVSAKLGSENKIDENLDLILHFQLEVGMEINAALATFCRQQLFSEGGKLALS